MGMFSEWFDGLAQRQFGKDRTGRLAFFPNGWRKPGYYLDGSNEYTVKALLKMYAIAAGLVNLTGTLAAYGFTQAILFDEHRSPLRRKLEVGLSVYAIAGLLLYIFPALLLWKVYKGLLAGICSPLTAVAPDSIAHAEQSSRQLRTIAILAFAGLLILAIGVFVAVSYRQ